MVQDFRSFLQNLVGGNTQLPEPTPAPPVQAAPQPTVVPQPVPQPAPQPSPVQQASDPRALLQQVMAIQQAQQAPPQPQMPMAAPPPAGGNLGRGPAMTPAQFATLQQAQESAPPEREGEDDPYGGTWVTVSGNYQGTEYFLLVPEEYAHELPPGATLTENGTIENEPERVQRAFESGEQGKQGDRFVGTLQQAPDEIQALFRTQQGEFATEQRKGPQEPEVPMVDGQQLNVHNAPPTAPSEAPVNERGQTATEVRDEATGNILSGTLRAAGDLPGREGYVDDQGEPIPPLTTDDLRKRGEDTNNAQFIAIAGMLESQNVFEVPVHQMVVRDQQGRLDLVPESETAPEGTEIVVYGGNTPDLTRRSTSPMGVVGDVLEGMEWLQRQVQAGVSGAYGEGEMNPVGEALVGGFNWLDDLAAQIPGVGQLQDIRDDVITTGIGENPVSGYPGFMLWLIQNPEAVIESRNNGYTDPDSGATFTGERAVWERYQSERNLPQRAGDAILTDPLNILPTMGAPVRGVGRVVQGLSENAPDIVRPIARGTGELIEDVGRVADIPEELLGTAIDRGVKPVARGVGRALGGIPLPGGRQVGDIVAPADETVTRNVTDEAENQLQDVVGQTPSGSIPEPTGDITRLPDNRMATRADDGTWTIEEPDGTVLDGNTGLSWDTVQLPYIRSSLNAGQAPTPSREGPPAGVADETVPPTRTASDVEQQAPLTRPVEPVTPAPPNVVQENLAARQASLTERPAQQQTLPTDRPIDDLGRAPDQRAQGAQQELPIDRPIDDLGQPRAAIRQDTEFQQSTLGQDTERMLSQWPEHMRPQTAADRAAGTNRAGVDYPVRAQDVARSLASQPEMARQWRRFMIDANSAMKKYAADEAERQGTRVNDVRWQGSGKTGSEPGFDVKRTWEVALEAEHEIRSTMPLFNRHFGTEAEMPPYVWKRWGTGDDLHTALDTIEDAGGSYRPGTPLHEATEVAIFHPDARVADAAFDDLKYRLGIHDADGSIVMRGRNYAINRNLPTELQRSPNILNRIPRLRQEFLDHQRVNADLAAQNADRLTVDDATNLSRIANGVDEVAPTLRDTPEPPLEGQDVFEEDLARSMDEEAAQIDPEGARVFEEDLSRQADAAAPQEGRAQFEEDLARQADVDAPQEGRDVFEADLARTAFADVPQQAAEAPAPRALPYRADVPVQQGPARAAENEAIAMPPGQMRREMTDTRATPGQRAQRFVQTPESPEAATMIQRIVDRRSATRQQYLSQRAGQQAAQPVSTTLPPEQLDSLYVRGRTPSATQMQTLGQRFRDGDTLLERWDRYTAENVRKMGRGVDLKDAEQRAADRVINDWRVENLSESQQVQYQKEYDRLAKTKGDDDKTLSEMERQIKALESIADRGSRTKFGVKYDNFMSGLREVFLYNVLTGPRYIATQSFGNTVTSVLTKHYGITGDIMSPRALRRAIEGAVARGEEAPSILREVRDQYGLAGERRLTTGGNAVRDQTTRTVDNKMRMESIPFLGKLSLVFANRGIRDTAAMFDVMPREALWAHMMDQNLLIPKNELYKRMRATLPEGLDVDQFDELWSAMPQRFSSSDLREAFQPYNAKWADRQARDWQEALTKTDKAARDEVKRVFFDGGERNIDRAAKRVFFFHYWMSRATPLYTEAIARDPVFLYNYAKLMETMQDDDDLSGTDFVKWFSSPTGYATLIRPDAFFQALGSFAEDHGYTPEGESLLGEMLRKSPIMVNPIVQSVANMAGFSGNTWMPDPLGLNKFIQFGQASVDGWNASRGNGKGPTGNHIDQGLNIARSWISDKLDWVPGVTHVPVNDVMAYKENEVRALVADIALERGLDLDDPIVQQSMLDSESELYQEAMKRYAMQDVVDIFARLFPVTAVLYPKSSLESTKQRSSQISSIYESEGTYTSEAQDLLSDRDLIAAPNEEAQTLLRQEDEYKALGTPEERGATSFYYGITFGSRQEPVSIGGRMYTPSQLQNMDEGEREALADLWAEETGNTERIESVREQRADYREANPEYAEYSSWRNRLNDYEGGPVGWWEDTAVGNPNARRWLEDLDDDDRENELTLTSPEAYMNFAGVQPSYWDPNPIETRDMRNVPYDPIGDDGSGDSGSSSSGSTPSGPSKESINKQIEEYNADMEAYNQAASQMFGGQPVNVDLINPMARSAVESNLRDAGIEKPRMGGYLYDYMQWAEAQGQGDSSIAAYLKWYRANNPDEDEAEETPAAD